MHHVGVKSAKNTDDMFPRRITTLIFCDKNVPNLFSPVEAMRRRVNYIRIFLSLYYNVQHKMCLDVPSIFQLEV